MGFGFRRSFGAIALGVAALGTMALAAPQRPRGELLYIGMQGEEIRAARLDPATGALSGLGVVAKVVKPFWMTQHPTLPILYAATDGPVGGPAAGTIMAYRINRTDGSLSPWGQATTGGGPTHMWFDGPSSTLLSANFGGGSASSIAIGRDGKPGALLSEVKSVGSGPTPRQTAPHAHGMQLAPGNKFVLISDLGADRLFVYPFSRATGKISLPAPGTEKHFVAAPGSGPRHSVAHPNGKFIYLLNELTANLTILRWNGVTGSLTPVRTMSTDRPDFSGTRSASELQFSRDGRFLYVGNRSEGSLVVYRVNAATGDLTEAQRLSAGGPSPWAFSFDLTGRWLIVAEQGQGKLVVFAVNQRTGLLSPTGHTLDTPRPVTVAFVR